MNYSIDAQTHKYSDMIHLVTFTYLYLYSIQESG